MALRPENFFKGMWIEAWQDLRSIRKKRALLLTPLLSFAILIWTAGLLALSLLLGFITRLAHAPTVACTPDGAFNLDPDHYSYWSRTGLFQVTLAYGNLSFGSAKFIDVAWDVVFGRVGQAILALCSWHVFSLYVTTSMETAPVTYDSFRAIFLEAGPSFWSTVRLIRDFASRKGFHSRIAMGFIVVTMWFTLAFPTLASAMTGYTSFVKSYVPDHQNGNRIRFDGFVRVLYIVHDGQRIGQKNDYLVTDNGTARSEYEPLKSSSSNCDFEFSPKCFMQNNITDYVQLYGYDGHANSSSEFMGFKLDAPSLNITKAAFYDPARYDSTRTDEEQNLKNLWVWADEVYDYDYVSKQGTCQSTGGYQWGFSFVQLFCMNIMLLIWTIGILLMWDRAYSTKCKRGRESVSGKYRAVAELAAAMRKELGAGCLDVQLLSEKEIQARIAGAQGGSISYSTSLLTESPLPYNSFRRWLGREKWWVCVTLPFIVTTSFVWIWDRLFSIWMIGPSCGLLFALCVGSSKKSRALFILVWTVMSSVPVLCLVGILSREGYWRPFGYYYYPL